MQVDGDDLVLRQFALKNLAQLSNTTFPNSGTHQGIFLTKTYFYAGGDDAEALPCLKRISRSSGAVATRVFHPQLSQANLGASSLWQSNVTHSVELASDKVALRILGGTGTARNVVLVGSWSAFLANSATWVADSVIELHPSQSNETFQGIALFNNKVYMQTGNTVVSSTKRLFTYSLTGAVLEQQTLTMGNDGTSKREPEGLHIYTDPKTGVAFIVTYMATGASGANIHNFFRAPL
jgi:hypothetical protein